MTRTTRAVAVTAALAGLNASALEPTTFGANGCAVSDPLFTVGE